MPSPELYNQIVDFLKKQPYWYKFAGSKLLHQHQLTEDLLFQAYNLFLEDYGLKSPTFERPDPELSEIPIHNSQDRAFGILKAVRDVHNVNALQPGQCLSIGSNLTIVYGNNGVGKSGYIRLLNNAFAGRGDKRILPNIFSDGSAGDPAATFVFDADNQPYDLDYPTQAKRSEFSQYAIYDSECVRIHLENENTLTFTPEGFDFFDNSILLFDEIKRRLQIEIRKNRPANDFADLFRNEGEIKNQILQIGASSDIKKIKALMSYTSDDEARLQTLISKKEGLLKLNIPKQIAELEVLKDVFHRLLDNIKQILSRIDQRKITEYNKLIQDLRSYNALAKEEGIESLKDFSIECLGTLPWQNFIKAAREYALTVSLSRDTKESYPIENDRCLFCLQQLGNKEHELVHRYWQLIRSQAQEQIKGIENQITSVISSIERLPKITFDESSKIYAYAVERNSDLTAKWRQIFIDLENRTSDVITKLKAHEERVVEINAIDTNELLFIEENLSKEIATLMERDPKAELVSLELEISALSDQKLLSKLQEKIIDFIERHKWAAKAEARASNLRTNSLTIKQGELFAQHVTDSYTRIFMEECEKLDAPAFIAIAQRNVKGQTLRRLHVRGKTANHILSEGEQRAVCLADFLTEVTLNNNNKGIVLDDPVTSLDHERREKIAMRLVQESLERQVIIFTHDISFLGHLQFYAAHAGIKPIITTIRKTGALVGVVKEELPWIAQKLSDRIGYLRNELPKLKKLESSGAEDDYAVGAKTWYMLLREAWERSIEERLFKGVVERFSPAVQTLRLKNVEVSSELIQEVTNGMTQASKWVHDQPGSSNPQIPKIPQLEADLEAIDTFAKKCKPNSN